MKNREPRLAVLLPALMRLGVNWMDISIRNVSPHGMMLHAIAPPRPGCYIEIRRATMTIIARAIWVKGNFFGIRTQEIIDPRGLADGRSFVAPETLAGWNGAERRTIARAGVEERYHHNRHRAMLAQYATFVGGVAAASVWLTMTIAPLLAHTSNAITLAMR